MFSLYIENAAPKDLRKGLLEKIRENLIAGGDKMSAVTEYFREEGRKEGFEKGIKQEKEQRNIEIAIVMIKNNEPVEKIALYTGLSNSQIIELRKRLDAKTSEG
jgi:predicted transposase/invertase (TIGR01784 family)